MAVIKQLNGWQLYLISGAVILFVGGLCTLFIVRAYRAGAEIGMDKKILKRAITSSATFSVLPSVSILLGVIALSGTLGIPLPWLRLSVIGALHYETSVADIAARSIGLSGLNAAEMTLRAFTTIGLLMTVGIIWGMLLTIFGLKKYLSKLQKPKSGSRSFGDTAMTAMFIGLISAYLGSYIGTFTSTGNYMPLIVLVVSALVMAVFVYFVERKKMEWLENFSIAASMLVGMTAAVLVGIWV
ncbi:MAG: DUF5058 family protein [Oscillospiraceae bacterium]|nr:DUF5058 family protein [Oscillospiraceae bacterium]